MAEAQFSRAGEADRAFVRAVLIFELLEQRVRRRSPHLGGRTPRHGDLTATFRAPDRGGTRERERPLEARRAVLEPNRTFRLDRERMIGRVDADPHSDCAIVTEA